jgi:hypothetical protein
MCHMLVLRDVLATLSPVPTRRSNEACRAAMLTKAEILLRQRAHHTGAIDIDKLTKLESETRRAERGHFPRACNGC